MDTVVAHRAAPDKRTFGLVVFLAAESMTFAGLISAHIILRPGQEAWPPPGQPRLPAGMTAVATAFLLISAWTAYRALSRAGEAQGAEKPWLGATWALGALFLGIQGVEWAQLIGHGLTMTSSVYGALFYTVIGFHALHVAIGMCILSVTSVKALAGRYGPDEHTGVRLCAVYWWYVVLVWPTLYVLVYLL
ncbi:heme-copper oxidase subunit III [Candidatus Poribacteria bacterium]|jgi:cytochrome c oxidase subunit III|nr:heme-copper oxidase subunit III [Candidatus Poribacteria bacterium]MBT5531477.1 heme-copper oxidase subunit III [Candidatus Poribacteria bacterium]MBT5710409.1 heme-copper oxidase subunit III [Candidatus Poribacteria bacterium]MBT7099892.1 heme-copper oxidase subunit III [Candidatus Poribacteria bacterium]MBT7806170.1 heme-copper oxidase subunit III [Candidatus Poribacteria bacterium]